jgi:hypothetical protein
MIAMAILRILPVVAALWIALAFSGVAPTL